MASYTGPDTINRERFRASLSLLLPASDIDPASEHLEAQSDLSSDTVRYAIRSVQLRLLRRRVSQFVRLLRRVGHARENHTTNLFQEPSDAGLTLALHLGLGLTTSQLADILGSNYARVSRELLDIRLSLTGRDDHHCKIFLDELGRYRDGHLDLGLAATLARHRVRCPACHNLLQEFEVLDSDLISVVEDAARSVYARPPQRRTSSQRIAAAFPTALVTVLLLGVAAIALGFGDTLTRGSGTPLFAAASNPTPGESGWIILGTPDGGLQAFDPNTGRRHSLRPDPTGTPLGNGANFMVSPDEQQIAVFAQNPVPGLHWATRQIDIISVTGDTMNQIELRDIEEAGWPTGWLTDSEILMIKVPEYQQGEIPERFLQRLEEESSLIALNVSTGAQRIVYEGAVAQVIPSPDGSRVAMVRPRDPREPGTTVDLWRVENGELADHLTSIEHRFTWDGGLLWDPSSEAVYLGYVSDFSDDDSTSLFVGPLDEFRGETTQVDLLRVDRDEGYSIAVDSGAGNGTRIIGISPDSGDLVYQSFTLENPAVGDILLHSADNDQTNRIDIPANAETSRLRYQPVQTGVLGYPMGYASHRGDGGFMMLLSGDHYLASDATYHEEPHQALYLTVFDEELNPSIVSVLSSRRQIVPLRWVESEILQDVIQNDLVGSQRVSSIEAVDGLRTYVRLDGYSTLSPDGTALTMAEAVQNTGRPFLWYPQAGTGRWIAQRTEELSWYTDGHAVLGVTEVRRGDARVWRLTQHSAGSGGGSSVDAFFDPAGIGDASGLRYALPASSTDAGRTSYFVIDTERNRASLWISDWQHGSQVVHRMRHSSRSERLSPLTGQWLDDRSFLFTEAFEWTNGLPNQSTLKRLTIADDGEVITEQLLVIEARGRDYGVAIQEFAVDPTGAYIAYRVRHFTDPDDASDGYDTVHLATTKDVTQALEIQRGNFSKGLIWSPSGHALALTIDERVGIYFTPDNRFEFVTTQGWRGSYPTWISDSELWFNIGSGSNAQVRRVTLD